MDLTSGAPGRAVEIDGGVQAVVPAPLPPDLEADWNLAMQIGRAGEALGALEATAGRLPNPDLVTGSLLRREAVLSSRIEGTVTSLEQLALFEASPEGAPAPADARVVSNYVVAVRRGLSRLDAIPVSLRLLREVHQELFAGVGSEVKRPGEFRTVQNYIGNLTQGIELARFVPPPAREVLPALHDLERFMNGRSGLPDLVELALIHYQFEAIHPFEDGNGRVGRILIKLLMRQRGILSHPVLSLSAYFHQHREAYVDHLLNVSVQGAWMPWVRFFLDGVMQQAREAETIARRLLNLREEYRGGIQSRSAVDARLIDALFERPAITAPGAARQLGVSAPTARASINRLVSAGILGPATGRARNRIYAAWGILAIAADRPATTTG